MPSAVAATVSFLKGVGVFVAGAGVYSGTAALVIGTATVVAGAIAAQKLISSLYSVPNLDSDSSRQATVRGTVEPQKLIYGEALVSGPISFVGVSGTDNRDLYHSIVLAGHPSDSISDIYFDDERIQSAHINSAGNVTTGVFGPKDGTTICVVRKLTGSQTTADSVLDGAFNTINSSEHIGTNLTYIVTKFTLTEESQETWDKFLPNDIKALVKGKKVYDPRQDNTSTHYDASVGVSTQRATNSATWAWSDNPVWCLVDYLTDDRFGMDIDLDRIDLSKAVDAADICDVAVSVPGGGESRYTCNGVIFGTATHKTNINKILSAMNGMLTYTNGKYVIRAGAFESVGTGMNLTEDNMIGPVKLKTSFERNERFNTITGTFIDPSKSFKEIEFPKVQITSALTRDNNEELTRELKLSMTNSRYMAQRISHKLIQLSDLQKVLTFPTNLAGVNISVGDRVNVTLSEFGYTNKTFVCLGWTLSESGAGGVNLTLREDDSSSYADLAVSGYSTVTPAGGIEQGFFGVPDPSGLSATSHVESIELDWTNPANMTGIIAIEIFASPNSSWSSAVKIGETIGTQFIHDESNGVDAIVENDQRYYWVRARRFPAGEGSDAVSDRNPDSDTSTVQATKGALGNLADLDTVGDSQIDDNAVTNRTIADDAVDTDQINNGAVDTDQIANDAVTFDKIDVNELSAITADLGDITAGTIQSVPSDSALSAIPTDVFTRSSNQNIPTGTESGAFIDLAEGSFLFGDSESFISFAENSGGTAYELDIKGVLAPTSLDFSGVTATTPMPSNIKVSGYADASIGVNAISEAVYAEIATRVGTGSGGFYSSEDDHYLGESAKYITIGTTQNHGTGDVTVQVAISDSFGYPRNFAVNSDQLKIKITLQYKVASGSTWVAAGSTQTRALTPTILQYATVYSIDESYSVTLTSGSGQDIADSTDYDFRVKLERVGAVSAFATVANGGANDTTGTPVTLEVSEGQAGSSVDNANTLDNLDSTQFLRSDADDTLTGDLTLVGALKMGDSRRIELGDDTDLKISGGGGGGTVENDTGNLTIKNRAVDGDIYFQSDDGTGVGTDTYFFLDGGEKKVKFLEEVVISDDLTVTGSLTITGNIDQYNVTDLDVSDKTITVNSGNTQSLSDGAGLIVDRGSAADASILWDETNDEFDFSHNVTAPNLSITNWNTAYTYSQVGHLPLAGGVLTGNVSSNSTITADTLKLTADATNTSRHRVSVYDSGTTSYGMMLWNTNGTGGDWATMIYGPNQNNRRISFGKITASTFDDHGDVTESMFLDLDNDYLYVKERVAHYDDSDTYVQFDNNRVRLVAGGTTKFDSNNTYLTAETDTLATVTGRGATTTNAISTGAITSTSNITGEKFTTGTDAADGIFVGSTQILNASLRELQSINKIGINTNDPNALLHVESLNTGAAKSTYGSVIFEADDAHIDITSTSAGTWGSSILLREAHSSAYRNAWAISRKTGTAPDLVFNFGTANDHNINGTKFTFASNGDFTAAGSINFNSLVSTGNFDLSAPVNSSVRLQVDGRTSGFDFEFSEQGDFKVNGQTVITSARDMENVGTIESGAINTTGNFTLTKTGSDAVIEALANGSNDPILNLRSTQGSLLTEGFQIWYDNSVGDVHIHTTYPNDAAAIRFHTRTGTNKATNNERFTIQGNGDFDFHGGDFSNVGNLDVNGIIDNTRNNGSVAAPNTSDHTAGTRISFYDASATSWYAMGIENSTLWFNSDVAYKWYQDGALRMHLNGANLTVTGSITSNGYSVLTSGSQITTAGAIVAGDASSALGYYVGANQIIDGNRALKNIVSINVSGDIDVTNGKITAGESGHSSSTGVLELGASTSNGWGTTTKYPYIGSDGSGTSLVMIHNPHVPFRTDNARSGASGRAGLRMARNAAGSWWDMGLIGDEWELYRNGSGRFIGVSNSGNVTLTATTDNYFRIESSSALEQMVRFKNSLTNYWYAGIRRSAGIASTADFHIYSTALGDDAFALTTSGDLVAKRNINTKTGEIQINGQAVIDSSRELTVANFVKAAGNNLKFSAGGNHILNIDLNGKIYPQTDNHTDLGFSATAARFRNLNLSGNIRVGGTTAIDSSRNITAGTISSGNITAGNSSTSASIRAHYNDGSYMTLEGYGLSMNRGASYIRPTTDGDKTLYIGGADASLDWNEIHFRSVNGLALGGTNFIDGSRNLQNIGTISSGAITSSGTVTASGGNSTNWNTAYGWGNHASAGYITGSPTNLSVSGYLNIGTRIGTVSPGLSITGDANSTPIIAKTSAYATTFSVLPWSNGEVYLTAGNYYDDGTWVHASPNTKSCLFAIEGDGARLWTSSNSTASWNVVSGHRLWDSSGVWKSSVNTGSTITSAGAITAGNTSSSLGYYVGTTQVIQGSTRNLVNIGTITGGLTKLTPSGYNTAPQGFAALNIGRANSTETRAIDIWGSWSNGESKSITANHGTSSTNIVGQINFAHKPTNNTGGSSLRFGKLYHGTDTDQYTMELHSLSTTRAYLSLNGGITQVGEDATYAGYGVIGFGGRSNGSNRIFGRNGTADGLFLASATGRGIYMRTNGGTANTLSITEAGQINIAQGDIKLWQDGTYSAGYGTIGFGGTSNGSNRVFGSNTTGDGLYLASATGRGIFFRVNGSGANSWSIDSSGNLKAGASAGITVIDASRNITANTISSGAITSSGDVEVRSGNKLILQRPNNGVASNISTDSTGAMILDSLNTEGFFFNNNGTNAFKLDPVNATFAGTISSGSITSSGDVTLNNDSLKFAAPVYRRSSISSVNNSGFTTLFTVDGNGLASTIRMTLAGTTGSVVVNLTADITVGHYQDILITSRSGFYTLVTLKVISSNNEDFAVQAKTNSANAVTLAVEVFPLNNESVTFTSSHSFTGSSLEHVCNYGVVTSGTGGNDGNHTVRGRTFIQDGSQTAPALAFESDSDTGIYRSAINKIGLTCANALRAEISNGGIDIKTGGVAIAATTVIDASRNLTNIAGITTESSSSNLVDLSPTVNGQILHRLWNKSTGASAHAVMRIANNGNTNQGTRLEFSDQTYYVGTISADRTNGMQFYVGQMNSPLQSLRMTISNAGNMSLEGNLTMNSYDITGVNLLVVDDEARLPSLKIGTTTVIDSSRNLGNINAGTFGQAVSAMDTTNLDLEVVGNTSIRGSSALYFGITSNNYNSWKGKIWNNNTSTMQINAQALNFNNSGYGTSTFFLANSTGFDIRTGGLLINQATAINSSRDLFARQGTFTHTDHNYVKIENTSVAKEQMIRFRNSQTNYWYAGIRTSAGIASTADFHIYSTALADDVFALTTSGDLVAKRNLNTKTGAIQINGTTVIDSSRNGVFERLRADGGNLIMGDEAFSTSASYVGMKTSIMSGSSDYMIISGISDGSTYISAKNGLSVYIRGGGNASHNQIQVPDSSYITATTSNFYVTGNITAYYSSDKSLKENIRVIDNPIEKIKQIRGVYFDWTDDYIKEQSGDGEIDIRKDDVGVIAQDVQPVLDEVVTTRDDGTLAVKYEKMVALCIEAIKEQQDQIDSLKDIIEEMKNGNN